MSTLTGTIHLPDGTLLVSGIEVDQVVEPGEGMHGEGEFDLTRWTSGFVDSDA
jgi:hypothetical protein